MAGKGSKPCPNLPKGVKCPLCAGTYLCLQSWRRKAPVPQTVPESQNQEPPCPSPSNGSPSS